MPDAPELNPYGSPMHTTRRAGLIFALALPLGLMGCGGKAVTSATPAPTATVRVTVTAEPSPSAAPTGETDSRLGAEWQSTEGNTIKVLEYRRGAPGAYAASGERWDAVLAKTCVGMEEGAALSWIPWRLLGSNAGQYEASGEASGDFLAPQYPFAGERTISKGQCVRGWIYFGVPKDARLRKVNYTNDSGTHTWNLNG